MNYFITIKGEEIVLDEKELHHLMMQCMDAKIMQKPIKEDVQNVYELKEDEQ